MTKRCSESVLAATRLRRPGLVVTAMFVLSACGGAGPTAATPSTQNDSSQTSAVIAGAADTGVGDLSPDSLAVVGDDGETVLLLAIDELGTTYRFTTVLSLDGETVSSAVGYNAESSTEVELTQQDTTLVYRTVGQERWVQRPNGSWEALLNPDSVRNPVDPLRSPLHVESESLDGSSSLLRATYKAETFGLSSGEPLTVEVVVTDGVLASIHYEGALDGADVVLESTFVVDADVPPIVAPA